MSTKLFDGDCCAPGKGRHVPGRSRPLKERNVYRKRLREEYTEDELRDIYAVPHDHSKWADHHLRVNVTAQLVAWMVRDLDRAAIADLSCGDAEIPRRSGRGEPLILGDFAPGYEFQGPLEQTIEQIRPVDLYVLSETIEHVNDPDAVLRQIRAKAGMLVLTTPIGETLKHDNPEHYWGWDEEAMNIMLRDAGWTTVHSATTLRFPQMHYDYQIWGVS